jgi:hypothetical protein
MIVLFGVEQQQSHQVQAVCMIGAGFERPLATALRVAWTAIASRLEGRLAEGVGIH